MMTNNLPKDYIDNLDSFIHAENIIKKHSKTFYQAFSNLPDKKKYSIFAVYAFCRKADDLIDESNDPQSLTQLEIELKLFKNNKELDTHLWKALRVVFNNFNMKLEPFFDQIKGQKMDTTFSQPNLQISLEAYSFYVAGSVGLMILPILSEQSHLIEKEAIKLGKAMQITNILRDLYEDYLKNRIYLPKRVLEYFDYDITKDFNNKMISDNFYKVFEFEKNKALKFYNESENMIKFIDEDSKKAVLLALEYYKYILYQIEENNFDIFGKKTKVSKLNKLKILNEVNKKIKNI